MKSLLLFIFVLYTHFAYSQVIKHPETHQKVRVFEHKDFILYYPKRWKEFKKSHPQDVNVLFSGTHKSEKLRVGWCFTSEGKEFTKGFLAESYFFIKTDTLKEGNLENRIAKINSNRKEKIKKNSNFTFTLKTSRVSESYYIQYLDIIGKSAHFKSQKHTTHFRQKGNRIYQLVYTSSLDKHLHYLSDATMIFKMFRFKNIQQEIE